MISSLSRIRGILGEGVSRLAIAVLAAVLLGLPSAAGATFLHPSEISQGDLVAGGSFGPLDDSLTLWDFHDDLVEHAAHDFNLQRLLAFLADFEPDHFGGPHHFRATFAVLKAPPWIDEALRGKRDWSGIGPGPRPSCKRPPPNVVPEPETVVLLAGGLIGLAFAGRKRRL